MKLLHTSDWHIGRTFHTHPTLEHVRVVLEALVAEVRGRGVDVVLVSGDVFDSAMPSADAYGVLSDTLRAIRSAGARVVVTSGNHDSATRLGFQAEWAGEAGVHVLTRHEDLDRPVVVADEHGDVAIYGIPFLEPALIRHHYPDDDVSTHTAALEFAMARVRRDLAERASPTRSVVLSHCFAAGVTASDVERDITAGGIDLVPAAVFDGPDYVALGHIHGRSTISDRVRYSGAPLHYSFAEAGKPRGAWLVELDAAGLSSVDWVDLPVPRALVEVTGELAQILVDPTLESRAGDWVKAILTDPKRPLDAMRALQARFAHCVALEHRPPHRVDDDARYRDRLVAKSDREIVADFVEFVRGGVGLSEPETEIVSAALREIEGERVPS
ncbi:exonuclease SbcCD subunit D [Marisediminicola sp. LYQ134]|uniref:exonuclease SbcCD subunit D n=1 Tax=unclassified Marisediminicola TaxID=2618316 RepID=UPI0039836928